MVNRPSVPEIITVNSEELQTQIRDLLPSQNGFGSELQASNVITPIIDLTRTAEGSGLPDYLQTALAFGSQTDFTAQNASVQLANSPGFYRIVGGITITPQSGLQGEAAIQGSDGLSTKNFYKLVTVGYASTAPMAQNVDITVFLAAGQTISASTNTNNVIFAGSIRQVATCDGTLVQPNGYPL